MEARHVQTLNSVEDALETTLYAAPRKRWQRSCLILLRGTSRTHGGDHTCWWRRKRPVTVCTCEWNRPAQRANSNCGALSWWERGWSVQSVRVMPCQSRTVVEVMVWRAAERSGQRLQSRAVMALGWESHPQKAVDVLPTPCSSFEPTCWPQKSKCRDDISLEASCLLCRALPAKPDCSDPENWIGNSRRPAASCHFFFSPHTLYCIHFYQAHKSSCIFQPHYVLYLFQSTAANMLFYLLIFAIYLHQCKRICLCLMYKYISIWFALYIFYFQLFQCYTCLFSCSFLYLTVKHQTAVAADSQSPIMCRLEMLKTGSSKMCPYLKPSSQSFCVLQTCVFYNSFQQQQKHI